ncbi:MAG: transketolase C-terminal domain-containing protein [Candidatus Helarchaeota archaeon]
MVQEHLWLDMKYDSCEKEFIWMGNTAMAEGCLAGGCRFFAGYPITPQNEVPERLSLRLPQLGGKFIQMEDEIGSIAAVVGAASVGARAMTSTSGPGYSLMQEIISWATTIELPLVIADVQRTGPGSGLVSLPHHSDVMQAHYGGNGDYINIALAPASCQELFDFSIDAFNYAEEYRTPTIILSDAWLGHIHEKVKTPSQDELNKRIKWNRNYDDEPPALMPFSKKNSDGTFDIVKTPVLGTPHFPWWVPSISHVPNSGFPIEGDTISKDEEKSYAMVEVVNDKIIKNEHKISSNRCPTWFMDDADYALIAYGMPARSSLRAVKDARKEGIKVGLLKMEVLWPFPKTAISKLAEQVKKVIVPELNWGQMFVEIEREVAKHGKEAILLKQVSKLHEPAEIMSKIKEVCN